jgi:hypothetical protein
MELPRRGCLVSSMWCMADEATSVGAAADETVVVAPVTVAAPELAWSSADEVPVVEPVSWRVAWGNAAIFVVVGMVLAGVIGAVGWASLRDDPRSTPVTQSAPAPAPLPSTSTTPKPLPTKDDLFIATLERDQGVPFDRVKALSSAQWVCAQFAQGQDMALVTRRMQAGNPDQTPAQVTDFVGLSLHFYCPQYEAH